MTTWRRWSRSATGSTACRWPSSWPPRASSSCRRPRCWAGWSTGCRCSAAAHATCRRASRPCGAPSAGATTCSTRPIASCSPCFSVFVGAVDLESVEGVCSVPGIDVLDGLSSLVDKSLVRRRDSADGETRYRMLETIREYAAERLDEAGRTAELRTRHAVHLRGACPGHVGAGGRRRPTRHARSPGGRPRRAAGRHHVVGGVGRRTDRALPGLRPVALLADARLHHGGPAAHDGRPRAAGLRGRGPAPAPRSTRPVAWPTGTTTRSAHASTTRRRSPSDGSGAIRRPSRSRSTTCRSRTPSGTTRP